jgi:hypothetical protein
MLGAEFDVPAALGWLEAKAEFVRLANELLSALDERQTGLSRYGRTQLLAAAHTVIVIMAYFEMLPRLPAPDPKLARTEQPPDERRAGLARAYQAGLEESIVESGEVPPGLQVPTLGDAYITPRFRVASITAKTRPSEESWWAGISVRDTLEDFLIGFLTSPKATIAPLLVLGRSARSNVPCPPPGTGP